MARNRHRRRTKPGSLEQLTAVLWRTILEIEEMLHEEDCPPDRVLKAGHCLAELAGAFRAVTEVVTIEQRIRALKMNMAPGRNGHP
jgi:hypothetical protein